MIGLLALVELAALADGPSLDTLDQAVTQCDRDVLTRVFAAEPARRRHAAIEAFHEQQAIVAARRDLAARRLAALSGAPMPLPPGSGAAQPGGAPSTNFEVEAQQIADRQQALDDARMLDQMRDKALDMMRQQYLVSCSAGLAQMAP